LLLVAPLAGQWDIGVEGAWPAVAFGVERRSRGRICTFICLKSSLLSPCVGERERWVQQIKEHNMARAQVKKGWEGCEQIGHTKLKEYCY
jgi:hypothetical protein